MRRIKRTYKELQLKRGRFIECQGCPTVTCTCFTELEDALVGMTWALCWTIVRITTWKSQQDTADE